MVDTGRWDCYSIFFALLVRFIPPNLRMVELLWPDGSPQVLLPVLVHAEPLTSFLSTKICSHNWFRSAARVLDVATSMVFASVRVWLLVTSFYNTYFSTVADAAIFSSKAVMFF